MFDYAERRRRLSDRMQAEGVDVLFLGLSADLEYLSGVERGIPFFGQSSYAHGWVAGAFFRPDADPVFVLPRMVAAFDLPVRPEGEIVIVNETDDGFAEFERVARSLGSPGTVAVGDRVWAETTLNLGRVFGFDRLCTGSSLVNELRRVKTPEELEAMARACRTVEQAMEAVTPRVQPGSAWPSWWRRWSCSCGWPAPGRRRSPRTSSRASTRTASTRRQGRRACRYPRGRR